MNTKHGDDEMNDENENKDQRPVQVATTTVVVSKSPTGYRAYKVQVVDGVTEDEVERLVGLALFAEARIARAARSARAHPPPVTEPPAGKRA